MPYFPNNLCTEKRLVLFATPSKPTIADTIEQPLEGLDAKGIKETEEARKAQRNVDEMSQRVIGMLDRAGAQISDKRRLELQQRINNASEGELQRIETEITSRSRNVSSFLKQIGPFADLFTQKEEQGTTLEGHIDKFTELTPEEQADSLRQLHKRIDNMQAQFKEMYEIFGGQHKVPNDIELAFKDLGYKKRGEWLKERKELQARQQKISETKCWTYLDKQTQNEIINWTKTLGNEALNIEISNLEASMKNEALYKDFELIGEFSKKHKLKLPSLDGFLAAADYQKRDLLNEVKKTVVNDMQTRLRKHSALFNNKDRDYVEIHLPKDPLEFVLAGYESVDTMISDLKGIDKSLKKIQTDKKLNNEQLQTILDHHNFANLWMNERQDLINQGTLEKYANIEHIKADKAYAKRLTEFHKHDRYGLVNAEGKKKYEEWFGNLSLEEKQYFLKNPEKDFLVKTKARREKTNKAFLAMPSKIQGEYHKRFEKADLEGREKLVKTITLDTLKLQKGYDTKITKALEGRLITIEAAEANKEWFAKQTIKDQEKYLVKCDIDDKRRQKTVDLFEQIKTTATYQELPQKEQKANEVEFYEESGIEEKITMAKALSKTHLGKSGKAVEAQLEKDLDLDIDAQSEAEQKITEHDETADKLITTGNYRGAIDQYEEALELIDKEKDFKQYQEFVHKIDDMKSYEAALTGESKESPIIRNLDQLVDSALEDPKLKIDKEYYTILLLTHELVQNSELETQSFNAADRIRKSTNQISLDSDQQEFAQDLATETDEELQVGVNLEGQAEVQSEYKFEARNFPDPDSEYYDRDYVNQLYDIQLLPPEQRIQHNIQLRNANHQEIDSKRFWETDVIAQRQKMENIALTKIKDSLAEQYPDQPFLIQELTKKAERQLTIKKDRHFQTVLEKI